MFSNNPVSQSMIDAVNKVLGETPQEVKPAQPVEQPKNPFAPQLLGEELIDLPIDPLTGELLELPELLVSGYDKKLKNKQIVMIEEEKADKVPTPTGMKVYGSRYGNSAKARKDQTTSSVDKLKGPSDKELLKDDEIDETGFHKAAHGAKRAGQSHFEFQGKKYPVTAKSHAEAVSEEGDCVTKPEAKGIAKKEVKSHEKKLHHKEDMTFADKLKASLKEGKATGTEEIFTDNNLGEEEMSDKQKAKREKIVMSMKGDEAGLKQRYGKNWKNVMYATATKQAMKEEVEGLDEAATRKDFQMVADLIRANDSHDKRKELAGHHAAIFHAQNPRFDHHKFMKACGVSHEVYGEEATPPKNTDIADKAYLKHKPGTVKGTMTQLGRFLKGKPEIKEDVEVEIDKKEDTITTDMLRGRVSGGKLNSFKNYKVDLKTSGEEPVPVECDKGADTKEKQKISTNPGPVDIKLDDNLATSPQSHFSKDKQVKNEEVRGELKQIYNKRDKMRDKEVTDFSNKHTPGGLVKSNEEVEDLSEGDNLGDIAKKHGMEFNRTTYGAGMKHPKHGEISINRYGEWHHTGTKAQGDSTDKFASLDKHLSTLKEDIIDEKVIAGTPGWKKTPKDVTDKSGAVHTPMSRAKDLARQSFKRIKTEMLGKISN